MDFQQYLLALQARRKVFLLVFAAIIVAATAVALILPKRYDATATVLLDARDEQTVTPGRDSPRGRAGWIYTQMDLVQSGKVAGRVVRDLKLAQQPEWREAYEKDTGGAGTLENWIADQLLAKVKVDSGASNVLIIKYSSGNAANSALYANAFAKAYLDTALDVHRVAGLEHEVLGERVHLLRAAVADHGHRLAAAGGDAARRGDHVRDAGLGVLDHVAAGTRHQAEHRHLAAAHRGERHGHLRVLQVLALLERVGDVRGGFDGGRPAHFRLADQRQADGAAVGDPRLGGEVGLLEHGDAHRVARPELVGLLRGRLPEHRQREDEKCRSENGAFHQSLLQR